LDGVVSRVNPVRGSVSVTECHPRVSIDRSVHCDDNAPVEGIWLYDITLDVMRQPACSGELSARMAGDGIIDLHRDGVIAWRSERQER
jgi:hypothetical protein